IDVLNYWQFQVLCYKISNLQTRFYYKYDNIIFPRHFLLLNNHQWNLALLSKVSKASFLKQHLFKIFLFYNCKKDDCFANPTSNGFYQLYEKLNLLTYFVLNYKNQE